jgi:hypothetical protein
MKRLVEMVFANLFFFSSEGEEEDDDLDMHMLMIMNKDIYASLVLCSEVVA